MSENWLWVFYGAVPEEGDCCLVWAESLDEAITAGRKQMGYEDEEDYDDSDFRARPATAADLLSFPEIEETDSLGEVLQERQRQILKWGNEHDDAHDNGELAKAAGALTLDMVDDMVDFWGYALVKKHRPNRRKQLVVAAALLLAELERMDRSGK